LVGEICGVEFESEIVVEAVGERRAEHLLGRQRKAIGIGQRRLEAAGVIIADAELQAFEGARIEGVTGVETIDAPFSLAAGKSSYKATPRRSNA